MTGEHAEDIRYGFIGTGMMGCEHIRNVVALPGAVAVAGCDPHGPSLQDAVQAAGGALSVHTDPATMLAAEDLDAVVVSTPNMTHREVLEPLWGRDLHVMIEKPLCTTVEDAVAVRAGGRVAPRCGVDGAGVPLHAARAPVRHRGRGRRRR